VRTRERRSDDRIRTGALNVNEHFKHLLDARFLKLQAVIVKAGEEARDDLDIHADAVDQANSESDRESALRRKDFAEEALESLVSARERLRVGSFGKCAECGEDIGRKRLAAIPWARFCVKCQQNSERA
jgi:DnaK suppressor protein